MINLQKVKEAAINIRPTVPVTETQFIQDLSDEFEANIYFKREDLQIVRSYKIRGAFNKIKQLSQEELDKGIVCASAGNHAQGVAYACAALQVKGTIFMPSTTPLQKVKQVRFFGKEYVDVQLIGDTYDDSSAAAFQFQKETNTTFVHPFDDYDVMAGQGTVGLEILEQVDKPIDYLFLPVGGGGLSSGVVTVFKELSPNTKIIGFEPKGAPSLYEGIKAGEVVTLESIDKFVDGAAVKKMGNLTFPICKEGIERVELIDEGLICQNILKLYNQNAIVAEPAGALSVSGLDVLKDEIKGKNVVCVLSGGNNDITRMEEMKERAMLYQNLRHYFIIEFPQRAGALREFLQNVLTDTDDIIHFEFTKKNSRNAASAVVGIQINESADFQPLLAKMKETGYFGEYLNEKQDLLRFLV